MFMLESRKILLLFGSRMEWAVSQPCKKAATCWRTSEDALTTIVPE